MTGDGLMQGAPAPPDRLVTLANWQDPPFNRWGFLHLRELVPTTRIARGDGPPVPLPAGRPAELDGVEFRVGAGARWTVGRMLEETFTDGLCVLHDGRVVAERYRPGMRPDTTHLLMSVSKSFTAALAGALAGAGRLDPAGPVTAYVGELGGTSFEGCTVQHLLDMRAGTRFNEDYEDPAADVRVYEQIALWRPRSDPGLPPSLYEYIPTLGGDAHGGVFEYRSILTDVLGWVLERAGGASFAELFERYVWSALGAQHDAEVTVDGHGFAFVDGGICATLRDLARFGELYRRGGELDGRRILPEAWVRETVRPDPELIAAFAASGEWKRAPRAFYHNCWWVLDPDVPVYAGQGINGQLILVHEPAKVVVAKLSTWPAAWPEDLAELHVAGAIAIAEALAAGSS